MRYALFLIIALTCIESKAAKLSVDKLFRESEFRRLKISPKGDYICAWRYFNNTDEIIITTPMSNKSYVVFKEERGKELSVGIEDWVSSDSGRTGVTWINWIDSNSLVIRYFDSYGVPLYIVADIKKSQEGKLIIDITKVIAPGSIVDTLPEEEDKVLFSTHVALSDRAIDVFKVDLREIDEDYEFFGRLNGNLKNGIGYYTDRRHRLRLAIESRKKFINFVYKDLNDNQWKIYYSIPNDSEKRKSEGKKGLFLPIGFIDDNRIAVASNVGRDKVAVIEFDLQKKKFGKVLFESPQYDVKGAELDEYDGSLKMVEVSEGGKTVIKYFAPHDKKLSEKLKKTFPGKMARFLDSTLDRKKMIIYMYSETNPGTFYYLNANNMTARPLADINPELEGIELIASETISISTKDGLKVESYITIPKGFQGKVNGEEQKNTDVKYPLVVLPHGGPIGVRDYDEFDPEVQFLADRGFAVLRVNYRGSGGYGKEFAGKGVGQWGKDIEDDIDLSVEHAIANYPIDKEKMCVMGASYGGYSALMSVIRFPQKYRCAISRYGVTDINLIFNQTNTDLIKENRQAWISVIGDPEAPGYKPKEVSPFFLAEKIKVPVMLIAGWRDPIADPEHTNRLKVALEVLGMPHEYLLYKETKHGAHSTEQLYQHEMVLIESFLRKTLGIDYPDTETDKDIQERENNIVDEEEENGSFVYSKLEAKPALK